MIEQESLLVTLVKIVDRLPVRPPKVVRGRPTTYGDRLFVRALVTMIVHHLYTANELLSVLAQPTAEMRTLRALLTVDGRFPARRTWERRLKVVPDSSPAQVS